MTPGELALTNLPEGMKWVGAAIAGVNQIIGFPGKRSDIESLSQFRAVKTHFHLSLGPPPSALLSFLQILPFLDDLGYPTLAALKDIRFQYFQIMVTLGKPSVFLNGPAEGEGANAPAFTPMTPIRDGTIRITPLYLTLGPLSQVRTLVHESAHFVGPVGDEIQDYAYRSRGGNESDDQKKYLQLPPQWAMRNADSYTYFAIQMAKGIDRIVGDEE
jgi:hypothetical protein